MTIHWARKAAENYNAQHVVIKLLALLVPVVYKTRKMIKKIKKTEMRTKGNKGGTTSGHNLHEMEKLFSPSLKGSRKQYHSYKYTESINHYA
jgi:hypothetical protein